MENNELLQAIKQEIGELRQDMVAQEKRTDEKLDSLRQDMATKKDINEIKAVIENSYKRIENLLREDYSRIEGNAAKGAKVAESYEEVKGTQADHTRAIQNHHERITVLEEKAI